MASLDDQAFINGSGTDDQWRSGLIQVTCNGCRSVTVHKGRATSFAWLVVDYNVAIDEQHWYGFFCLKCWQNMTIPDRISYLSTRVRLKDWPEIAAQIWRGEPKKGES